jgi:hypothetical protein
MIRALWVAAVCVETLWVNAATAEPTSPAGAAAPHATSIALPADTIPRLRSGDPEQIESALGDVRVSGRTGAGAVPAIVELLRRGLPQALTQAAIETLGDIESETSSEVVAWYARHRSAALRRSSVSALAKTRGTLAVKALRAALSDSDPGVRGLAASGLGRLNAKDTVGELFGALEHNVPEAAASIGALCSPRECERLAKKLESLPFDIVTSGLSEVLVRPSADVNDETKLAIVARLRAMATGEVNRFLRGLQARYPARASARVKMAIDEAVAATLTSPGAGNPETSP